MKNLKNVKMNVNCVTFSQTQQNSECQTNEKGYKNKTYTTLQHSQTHICTQLHKMK